MDDVFVSYKAEDRPRLKPLVEALEAEGLSVWWDARIRGGANWRRDIEEHLDAAKCVLVIWTKLSVGPDGEFVRDEAARAKQRGTYLPVRLDLVENPLGFGEIQALSLKGWKGDRTDPRFLALADEVRKRITGEPISHHPTPLETTGVTRRAVVAGAGVAVAAAASVGGWILFKPGVASQSIAVLPFANLSGDPSQAYFADGIAEEIRGKLERIAGLKVIGRTSSEAVRDQDAETVSRKLGVANILTGSVRQSPSTIRIAAELIDGGSGIARWSQDYDRSPGDAIKIQTDIAQNVASALSTALGVAARTVIAIGGTSNVEAQRLYIEAGAMVRRSFGKPDQLEALRLLDLAIGLDPKYADAYALKSRVLTNYSNNVANGARDVAKYRAESLHVAQIALQLAPNLAAAHWALCHVYWSNLEIAPAIAEQRRALQLAPGDADILANSSLHISGVYLGEASDLAEQAIGSDPLDPFAYYARILALFYARRYGEAVAYVQELQRNSPKLFTASMAVADSLVMLGRLKEAQSYYEQAAPDFWHRIAGEAIILVRLGDRAGAEAKVLKLRQTLGDAASAEFGEIYAQSGDKDKAIAALERAYGVKDVGLLWLRVNPFLDPLRSDSRFVALIEKMNFPY